MKKLIFFDIDGTLITEGTEGIFPDSAAKAIAMLRRNGHLCFINTGRTIAGLDSQILSINVDGYVCGCGTHIRLDGEILHADHFSPEMCAEIISWLDKCDVEWLLEGEEHIYYSSRPYSTFVGSEISRLLSHQPEVMVSLRAEDYSMARFDKFVFSLKPTSNLDALKSHFDGRLTFIDRGKGFFEIIPSGSSKATGMKFLEERLGVPNCDTIAVGDSTNDISMLEYAGTAIVMGNANEFVRNYADYVTGTVLEDGIFNAFSHLGLIC